jgi:hypothetical protein
MHAQIAYVAELAGGCRHVTIRLLPGYRGRGDLGAVRERGTHDRAEARQVEDLLPVRSNR